VPKEFQVQNPEFANPPTLYLSIEKFAKKLKVLKHKSVEHVKFDEFDEDINPHKAQKKKHTSGHHHDSMDDAELTEAHFEDYEIGLHWLKQLYNQKLKKNYNWYRTTQKGRLPKHLSKANDEVYRWVGRKGDHTLPSGFDDFPRPDASEFELHSDLTSWMGFLAGIMERVAELVEDEEGQKLYKKHREDILSNLKNVFFDKEHGVHCDLGVKGDSSAQDDDEEEEEEEVSSSSNPVERECHIGYPTILPLALELLDVKSPEFKKTLDIISDPNHLWSSHGLRSLSKSSPHYHTGEDYWRGNIWMNVNYLVVRALYHYKQQPSDLSEEIESVYHSLRNNLINTLSTSFKDTNLVWEQYNDDSGKGLRSKPFTGWSSLILLIMSEKYD
jgi:mannosyl-oligosaccharide glucosidase